MLEVKVHLQTIIVIDMIKYVILLLTTLCLAESCSSVTPLKKQSEDAALVSFFINELWDEPDCVEKQITIRQDTTDIRKLFYQRLVKEKISSFQILKFNSDDIIQISSHKNTQIKPYIYRIATGDDTYPNYPLEKNECKSVILNGVYHFKTFSLINITIESDNGPGYFASFKYKLKEGKFDEIQLVSYEPNSKNGGKIDLRKKYPMYVVPD